VELTLRVPTITLEGDANGAPHPDASSYAKKFSGKYAHRTIKGGVGIEVDGRRLLIRLDRRGPRCQ